MEFLSPTRPTSTFAKRTRGPLELRDGVCGAMYAPAPMRFAYGFALCSLAVALHCGCSSSTPTSPGASATSPTPPPTASGSEAPATGQPPVPPATPPATGDTPPVASTDAGAPVTPPVTTPVATPPATPPTGGADAVARGRTVFTRACGRCHEDNDSDGPSPNKNWAEDRMRNQVRQGSSRMRAIPVARLSDADLDLVIAYLRSTHAVR